MIAVFAAGAFFAFFADSRWAVAAWLSPPVEAPHKTDISVNEDEEIRKGATKANVLFFLDTSNGMLFSPKGRLPQVVLNAGNTPAANNDGTVANWIATNNAYHYLPGNPTANQVRDYVINMMRFCTFGNGTTPPVNSSSGQLDNNNHYGRDVDSANNVQQGDSLDPNDQELNNKYYFPFNRSGHDLANTFKYQTRVYSTPSSGTVSTLNYNFKNNVTNGDPLPYMMVFKNPQYWKNPPATFSDADLMPNDSRMYQMKLVMWRLLDDGMLFENIRFGMATAFSMLSAWGNSAMIPYKVSPYGYRVNGVAPANLFTWGLYSMPSVGVPSSVQAYDSVYSTWGITSTAFEPTATLQQRNFANRGYLKVPIADYDKVWVRGTSSVSQLDKFRLWIDGVEDMAEPNSRANQFYKHKNPELKTSGQTPLAMAIYQNPTNDTNRNWYISNRGIRYSLKDSNSSASEISGWSPTHDFTAGSGEAVGSVLDFFSPPYDNTTAAATTDFSKLIDESFPIRNVCDDNWVIIFTSGDDSRDYSAVTAVQNLYQYTKNNPVTVMHYENGERKLTKQKLEKPIRVKVVGFLDPDDMSDNAVALRNTLTQMAAAGDPAPLGPGDDGWDDDPSRRKKAGTPYFANNVPELLKALREIMVVINNDIQSAKGAMLEGDSFTDDNIEGLDPDAEKLNLYAGSYRIKMFDQWEGSLTKYVTAKDLKTGAMVTKADGELGKKMLDRRDSNSTDPRNLRYWAGGQGNNFLPIAFTGASGASRTQAHPLAEMVGLGNEIVASMDMAAIPNGNFNNKTHLSRAMFDWYHGYDVSYIDGNYYYKRKFMLADQGNSGISKVGPPNKLYSLPGFYEYAEDNRDIATKLYAQTNDGVLHVVNPKSMEEEKAILPPPTLLPRRMFSLKSNITNGRYRWIDVKDFMANTSDDIPLSSNPSYILDGPLQTRYFNMGSDTSPAWSAFLFGTLGRGGGGIYSMEVSDPANPQFYWYRETIENEDGGLTLFWKARNTPAANASFPGVPNSATIERGGGYWSGVYLNPDAHPYEQLGFNSPRPHFSVAETTNEHQKRNIIALSGGLQNSLDLNENGKMGAALYLIDPNEAYHAGQNPSGGARVFNSGSFAAAGSNWTVGTQTSGPDPYMGMMVGEPTFLATKATTYVARGMFASDNRGSIFYVSFIDTDTDTEPPLDWDEWKIRAIASLRKSGDPATASYSIPSGVVGGTRTDRSDEIWIGGGTASVGVKGSDEKLDNNEQMIFCFKMPDLRSGETSPRSRWTGLLADAASSGIADGDEGWYITLQQPGAGYGDEYVTTQPVMFGGNLYAGTFRETTVGLAPGACDAGRLAGKSRLYAVGWETGEAGLWSDKEDKYIEFDGIRLAGFTLSEKGKTKTLLVTYDVLDQVAADSSIGENVAGQDALSKVAGMNALSIVLLGADDPPTPVVSNDSVVNYWLYTK
jgi:hypothetical protein